MKTLTKERKHKNENKNKGVQKHARCIYARTQ